MLAARPMWRTASSKRCSRRASSPSIASRRTASHGSSTCASQSVHLVARADRAIAVARRDRRARREEPVRGLVPGAVQRVVQRVGAIGQLHRLGELAVVRDDVREVVAAARLQIDVAGRVRQRAGDGDVLAGELEATGRRLDPRREQQRPGPVPGRGRLAGRVEGRQDPLRAAAVAQHDPGPAEAVDDVEPEQRVVRGGPGQRGVDVGTLGPGEREVLGLPVAAHAGGGGAGRLREPRGVRAEGAVGQLLLRQRLERERADAVQQPVADASRRRRRSRATGSPAGRRRRSPPRRARRAPRARTRPPGAARRRRTARAPTVPACRPGTAARSSTRSSPSALAAAPACGWPGRSAR